MITRIRSVAFAGFALAVFCGGPAAAQTAEQSERLVRRLDWFQDQKFGFFMHWGAYSQLGCIESWPLVWADRKWSNPGINTREEMLLGLAPARMHRKCWIGE